MSASAAIQDLPPERYFYHEVTGQSSVSVREGKSIYFPWMPGSLYYSQGYEDFKELFLDVLKKDAPVREMPVISAPPCAEVLFHKCSEDKFLLQILNYSGFNGTTFFKPLPITVEVEFPDMLVDKVQLLDEDGRRKLPFQKALKIPVKGLYRAVLITGRQKTDCS